MIPYPLPEPREVRATFCRLFETDPERAVSYLHGLGTASGYIHENAAGRDFYWTAESAYETLECTINLSKPEKDPRAIAAAASDAAGDADPSRALPDEHPTYPEQDSEQPLLSCLDDPALPGQHCAQRAPKCDLCWENEGFPGTCEHPAKPGLRIAPLTLGGECWGLQFSPYAYFPEHCIALSQEHRPMKIDAACFGRLLDFVDALPFYFVGSNADLPVVGGSILSHDHFQGGRHTFPLMKAPVEREVFLRGFPEVHCGVVRWPASVVRLRSERRADLAQAAAGILASWQAFSFRACNIEAASASQGGTVAHNTLNPIVRKEGSTYTLDLVLRNNRTDAEHPWGIFHPNEALHHIKKENIGLIEIMGLAILPPRLATEFPAVQHALSQAARAGLSAEALESRLRKQPLTASHAPWAADVYRRRGSEFSEIRTDSTQRVRQTISPDARGGRSTGLGALHPVIEEEVGRVFERILETTGVFKRDEAGQAGWTAFLDTLSRM